MNTTPNSDHVTLTLNETDMKQFDCGHKGATTIALKVWETGFDLPAARHSEMCPECRKSWAATNIIRCAICGIAIPPGVRATLAPPSTNKRWQEIRTMQGDSAVICFNKQCCDTSEQAANGGRWNGSHISPTSLIHREMFS